MPAKNQTKQPNFMAALNLLENERGIDKTTVIEALKEALIKSYKKNYSGPESIIQVEIDDETGVIRLFEIKEVVDDVMDEEYQLSEEEAKEINPDYKVGDKVITEVSPEKFGRLAAIQTKQLLRQKIKEAEKEALFNEYVDKKDDIINGLVERVEPRFAIINIGKTGALLPINAQIPGEKLYEGQHVKVYVNEVERGTKGTHIGVSRVDPGLVKRLFELNVPEIYDGTVEIKSIARDAGERTKIAVYTDNQDIDPRGSCIGPKGTRVRNVVNELNGEMIDVIEYSEDPVTYISNALSPSTVSKVFINEDNQSALVIVPDDQLSLAIGKKGQNARLAVKLTKWKIDIESESDYEAKKQNEEIQEEVKETPKAELKRESTESKEAIKLKEELENQQLDEDFVKVISADTQDDIQEEDEEEYDPKYDEDIDYDAYDEYYDD